MALLLSCGCVAGAQDFEVDGICYKITSESEKSVFVANNPNCYGLAVIPETVSYFNTFYFVTAIGNCAFFSCGSITGIILPNTLTAVEEDAFSGCGALADIVLPEQ